MAFNDVASNCELRIALQYAGAFVVIEHLNSGKATLHEIISARPLQKRLLFFVEHSLPVFEHVVVAGVFAKTEWKQLVSDRSAAKFRCYIGGKHTG